MRGAKASEAAVLAQHFGSAQKSGELCESRGTHGRRVTRAPDITSIELRPPIGPSHKDRLILLPLRHHVRGHGALDPLPGKRRLTLHPSSSPVRATTLFSGPPCESPDSPRDRRPDRPLVFQLLTRFILFLVVHTKSLIHHANRVTPRPSSRICERPPFRTVNVTWITRAKRRKILCLVASRSACMLQ